MIRPLDYNTFELDDHPHDREFTLKALREFRRRNRRFKASLFCVPRYMRKAYLDELAAIPWIKIFPHGFRHRRQECWTLNADKLRILDNLADSSLWGRVFKPPRYGFSNALMTALAERGMCPAINSLQNLGALPDIQAWERRRWLMQSRSPKQYAMYHCRFPGRTAFGQRVASGVMSSLSGRNNRRYKRFLQTDQRPFRFVDELLTPLQVAINLGCGPHFQRGWLNLDHRPAAPHVELWKWPADQIPCPSNRADTVFSSHFLNYVEDFEELFLEVWRVLRPGGVYRLEEDDTDSGYCWRRKGRSHATGLIRSEPTKTSVCSALEKVGFSVTEQRPDSTAASNLEVLALHTRHRRYQKGHKFIVEARKDIEIESLIRPWKSDPRATKGDRRYRPDHRKENPQ